MPIFSTENQAVLTGLLVQTLRNAGLEVMMMVNDQGDFIPGFYIKVPMGERLGKPEFTDVLVEVVEG